MSVAYPLVFTKTYDAIEKLFLLKDMMRTPIGKQLAEKRDQFMRDFVHQIQQEYLMSA
jgi:HD superfamily phosphodiesterase